jgi:hypothetical protein
VIQPGGLAENSRWQAPRRHQNPPDPGNSPRRGDRKPRTQRPHTYSRAELRRHRAASGPQVEAIRAPAVGRNRVIGGKSRMSPFVFPRTAQGSSLIPTRSASKAIHSVQSLAGASAWHLPDQLLKANAFCESLRIMSFPVRLDRKTDARAPRRTKRGPVSFPHRTRQASDSARRAGRK